MGLKEELKEFFEEVICWIAFCNLWILFFSPIVFFYDHTSLELSYLDYFMLIIFFISSFYLAYIVSKALSILLKMERVKYGKKKYNN